MRAFGFAVRFAFYTSLAPLVAILLWVWLSPSSYSALVNFVEQRLAFTYEIMSAMWWWPSVSSFENDQTFRRAFDTAFGSEALVGTYLGVLIGLAFEPLKTFLEKRFVRN